MCLMITKDSDKKNTKNKSDLLNSLIVWIVPGNMLVI